MTKVQTAATMNLSSVREQRFPLALYGNSQWSSVIVTSQLGWWQTSAIKKLYEISSLPHNWDSYGSKPPTEDAVERAKRFIVEIDRDSFLAPRVLPISGGGVQFVWQNGARELEIEILPGGTFEYLRSEGGEPLEEGSITLEDRSKINSFITWLIA